ncbi:MAG: YaeQ family protein, partial [Burkholderiales bacterium]
DLTGAIELWIDVGQPDDKRIRKACGRADQVFVYSYGIQGARVWWEQIGSKLEKIRNLTVVRLPVATRELAKLADRNMRLTCTIQDRHVWLADDKQSVEIALETLKAPIVSMR